MNSRAHATSKSRSTQFSSFSRDYTSSPAVVLLEAGEVGNDTCFSSAIDGLFEKS